MYVFIVRPFGTKNGIDFERVQNELIVPAMNALQLRGGTTEPIAKAGNIRTDMFEQLAKADIVIADMSIHNANVFYELGARHALRDKRTYLIRSRSDDVPFDLRTDRYLEYDKDDPGKSVDKLIEGLRQTIQASTTDSPIFTLVPNLKPQDWTRLVVVPDDFLEEVKIAKDEKRVGDLGMLATEAAEFDWGAEGLRFVGRGLFGLKAWESARDTWEAVLARVEGDVESNLKLATIYQRQGELAKSDVAIDRVLADRGISKANAAEAHALKGSNEKTRWMDDWRDAPEDKRAERALASAFLNRARESYTKGFSADINEYYPGVNALALHVIVAELAELHPEEWAVGFSDDATAKVALENLERERQQLSGAVSWAVNRAIELAKAAGTRDPWAEATKADVAVLTETRAKRAGREYRLALQGAASFNFDAARRQLSIYRNLGVLRDNVAEAWAELTALETPNAAPDKTKDDAPQHVLVFTGHRIDNPGRTPPRFPAGKEAAACAAIRTAVATEQQRVGGKLLGIAGGASGGDILFHEVCAELGIPTRLYLAIPSQDYIVASVDVPDHPEWIDRFRAIEASAQPRVLSSTTALPRWLAPRKDYTIWQRNNLWTLHNALAYGGRNVTLIALWNGREGDGAGGTKDMVDQAKARGAKTIILDTNKVFAD